MSDLRLGSSTCMPSSLARLTALDHERLHRLLRRVVTAGPSQDRWRDEAVHLLAAHRAAEREVMTPDVVRQAGPDALSAAADLNRRDDELDRTVAAMAALPVPSPELVPLGERLEGLLSGHAELAHQVLAPLESAVARKEIRLLGGEYETRRDHHLLRLGADEPPPRRLDLSRAELYELARRHGIEGRSAMSRRDLIAELQRRDSSV
jgi:hypothetical protein